MWGDDNATGAAVYPFAPTLRVKRGEVMRIGLRNNLIRAPGETAEMGLRMGSVYKMQDFIALHTHGLHAGAPRQGWVGGPGGGAPAAASCFIMRLSAKSQRTLTCAWLLSSVLGEAVLSGPSVAPQRLGLAWWPWRHGPAATPQRAETGRAPGAQRRACRCSRRTSRRDCRTWARTTCSS